MESGSQLHDLDSLGFLAALDHDDRPTFVIDITGEQISTQKYPQPLFCNAALQREPELYHALASWQEDERISSSPLPCSDYPAFFQSFSQVSPCITFGGATWHFYTIQGRWRVVSTRGDNFGTAASLHKQLESGISTSTPALDIFNADSWTNASDHLKLVGNFNWSSTSVGPMHSWPEEIRPICNFILMVPQPAAVFMGPDLICLYNEAACPLLGRKYPACIGSKFSDVIEEAWQDMEPLIHGVRVSGQSLKYENMMMSIDKHGALEECFYDFTYIPIVRGNTLLGICQSFTEVTQYVLASRRMNSILEMSSNLGSPSNLSTLYERQLKALANNDRDVPFAMIFSVASSTGAENAISDAVDFVLESAVGISSDHEIIKAAERYLASQSGRLLHAQLHSPSTATVLSVGDGSLPSDLHITVKGRAFDEPCSSMLVSGIRVEKGVKALLLLGISPRRPYDDAYKVFVDMIVERLEASLTTILLLQAEAMRSRLVEEQAALERAKLSSQIKIWTAEAERSELKFLHFAEHAPIGIFIFNYEGRVVYANDIWYSMIGVAQGTQDPFSWIDSIFPEDVALVEELWKLLITESQPLSDELRLKRTFKPPDDSGEPIQTCILCSAHVQKSSDDTGPLIVGCFTDISQQKWAEEVQRRRTADIVETRRQQDEFVDMTFHEMRNPLAAVLHCSDEIITTIGSGTDNISSASVLVPVEKLQGIREAAKIITACCQHQNRIVDDILTMSKLSSGMLSIIPTTSQPVVVLRDGLYVFERQLHHLDINLEIKVDPSIESLGLDWVELDPGRLMQIVINLMTNAIKFTKSQAKRVITVEIKAFSEAHFVTDHADITYLPTHIDAAVKAGDKDLFLHVAVTDTGCGLAPGEQEKIFQRFSQAPRRSHVTYGGSGLGLYICRVLVEMQGGRIGFHSEIEVGSTFAFYVVVKPISIPEGMDSTKPIHGAAIHLSSLTLNTDESLGSSKSQNDVHDLAIPNASTSLDILVVEDNLINQTVLCRQLKSAGHRVRAANDGKEALNFLQKSQFWKGQEQTGESLSLLLMDLEMPVMNGLECMRKIRELQKSGTVRRHVPVIAVTANARQEQINEAWKAGMDEILLKPFRLNSLNLLMAKVMQNALKA